MTDITTFTVASVLHLNKTMGLHLGPVWQNLTDFISAFVHHIIQWSQETEWAIYLMIITEQEAAQLLQTSSYATISVSLTCSITFQQP